jgi:hypothetical protein
MVKGKLFEHYGEFCIGDKEDSKCYSILYLVIPSIIVGVLLGFWGYELLASDISTLCIGKFHFHHVYSGILIMGIFLILLFFIDNPLLRILFLLIASIGIGIAIHDVFVHWVWKIDPFSFICV